ncbi:MAG: STN domain-containing protein [Terrimonas sp.]|nr:STN domain-containing protein [Terrimonas sp.]
MKLSIALLLYCTVQVHAESFAQKITINKKNVKLTDVFKSIEQQSDYLFFYNRALIKNAGTLNIKLQNATIEEALEACLKEKHLIISRHQKC